jgi:hypothetical protein
MGANGGTSADFPDAQFDTADRRQGEVAGHPKEHPLLQHLLQLASAHLRRRGMRIDAVETGDRSSDSRYPNIL